MAASRCAAKANDLFGLVICPPQAAALPNGSLGTQKQGNQFGELPPVPLVAGEVH